MPTFKPAHTLLVRLLAVLCGGLVGGALRFVILNNFSLVARTYAVQISNPVSFGSSFDVRLFCINTTGVFIATWLLLGRMGESSPDAPGRLFWTTGVLGGLTTYSSLIGELGAIWDENRGVALEIGALSIGAACAAGFLAYRLRQRFERGS
jgi:fluoride ion exporter CrcB/FEX